MKSYFCDWEIRNGEGVEVKWGNTIVEAEEDVSPTEVFNDAIASIREKMDIPSYYHVRARTFVGI